MTLLDDGAGATPPPGTALRRAAGLPVALGRILARLPEVVEAISMLPTISAQLAEVTEHTRSLLEIHAEMARVATATTALEATLPPMVASMDRTLRLLAAVAEPLQGTALRIGRLTGGRPPRRHPPVTPPGV